MTTYVIGDILGCYADLTALLTQVKFNPNRDQLWSVGDLVNRGTDNLATLRWFYAHRSVVKVVLGNHDLHLLAHYAGVGKKSRSDNFEDILEAEDADILLDWLVQQPLMHREGSLLMTHAGIPPCWSSNEAWDYAEEVAAILRGQRRIEFFKAMYGNEPYRWSPHLRGLARLRTITNYFTRMRHCTASAGLDFTSKGAAAKAATLNGETLRPWFEHPHRLRPDERLFFGHWASLEGKTDSQRFIGLDTGCVWGRCLTVYAIETDRYFSHGCDHS